MAVLTIPNTFVAGTPALASEVNANFAEIVSWSNHNIGPDNFSSGWTEGISFVIPNGNAIQIVNNGNDEALKIAQNGILGTNKAAILLDADGATQTGTNAADFKILASAGSTIPAIHVLHGAVDTLKLTKDYLRLEALLKPPIRTTAQRNAIASPETGSILYDSTTQQLNECRSDGWAPIGPPVGSVQMFAGSVAPEGWLLCDGATLNSVANTKYAALFAVINTTYGGTGASSFKVPDCRGIFVRGAGSQTISGETYTATLGQSQKDATAVNGITLAQDPGHTHELLSIGGNGNPNSSIGPLNGQINAWNVTNPTYAYWGHYNDQSGGLTTPTAASSGTFIKWRGIHNHAVTGDTETRPANIALNYIIKY